MKHIKIYEEYSDEDLEDLMGDLGSVGLAYKPKFGVDYGYLSGVGDGKITDKGPVSDFERPSIIFSEEAKKYLIEKGILEDLFKRPIPDPTGWIKFIPEEFWNEKDLPRYKGETMRFYIRRHQIKEYYFLVGYIASCFTGFGFPTKSIDQKSRSIAQKNFLKKIEKTIQKMGPI